MALKFFRPKSGRFNTMIAFLSNRLITTIAGTTTTAFNLGGLHRRAFLERLNLGTLVVPASASALTGIVSKVKASDNTTVPLTAAFNLLTLVTQKTSVIPFLTTLTDLDRTLDEGDTLRFVVTAAGTITTQPTELTLTAEVAVLE
jgi:hypothetical protein